MDYEFENIQFNSDIPIKIFVHNLNYTQNHWHDALEILFVLEGSIHIGIGNSVHQLQKEDLIVINPNEIHTTSAHSGNLVLALQISSDWLNKYPVFRGLHLSCNSCSSKKHLHMNQIRKLLAQMMWVYNNQSSCFELKLQSYLFELLYQLFVYFKDDSVNPATDPGDKYMPRLSNIIHYLHENYNKDITLGDLAEQEYLSASYISRFFKKYIGTTFKEYIIRLRLEHAVRDLLFTDKSIAQLSFDNGFPNTNSFLYAFKEAYHETPSLYRKKAKADYQYLYGPVSKANNYLELVNIDIFSSLYKYLVWNQSNEASDDAAHTNMLKPEDIDLADPDPPVRLLHTWKNLMTIGKARDVLQPAIQEQLKMVQREIGFRYIRFHGILDDEMELYHEDEDGRPLLDFTCLDRVIDFLCGIGLKPFLELSFIPEKLARRKHTVFHNRPSYISMPDDMEKWCFLIRGLLLHCIERYGEEQVEEWRFEFWNEPDLQDMFWYDSAAEYYFFYKETYRVVKGISPKLQLGGPAICDLSGAASWLRDYFAYCDTENCLPDFFSFHCYIHLADLTEIHSSFFSKNNRITLSADPDYLRNAISQIRALVSSYGYGSDRLYMTEWNASPSHRDLSRDTLFMASFLVKNILENMDSVNSFGYWAISDFLEEFPIPRECFHGGMGVITASGIKKAGYYAFFFLERLGSKKIASGPGYYITSGGGGCQVLLYNYFHYDPLYCSMDHSGISHIDRYSIFKDAANHTLQLRLSGLPQGPCRIIERTLNRSHGSSFDAWVDMGCPEDMTAEHTEYLKSISVPHYHETVEHIKGSYLLQRCLTPHELRLIEFISL